MGVPPLPDPGPVSPSVTLRVPNNRQRMLFPRFDDYFVVPFTEESKENRSLGTVGLFVKRLTDVYLPKS